MELLTPDVIELVKVSTVQDHKDVMQRIFADAELKERIPPDEADRLSTLDWIVKIKEELDILRRVDDDNSEFQSLLQIRYLATAALLARGRAALDAAAA